MRERAQSISVLRLFSTLMIFVFHFLLSYTEFGKKYFPMYFVVQVFLFLSGYLYARNKIKSVKLFYAKNFVKILLPSIITLVIVGIAVLVVYICGINLNFYKIGLTGERYTSYGHYWFVGAILFCYLLTPVLWKIYEYRAQTKGNCKKFQVLEFLIIVLILADCVLSLTGTQRLISSYIIGFAFRRLKESKKFANIKLALSLISALIFILATVSCYFLSICGKTPLVALVRETNCLLLGVSLSVFVLTLFGELKSKKENKLLKITDKYSYTFFLAHQFFLFSTFSALYDSLPLYLNFIISLLCSILVSIIVDFVCNPITKKLFPAQKNKCNTMQNNDLENDLLQNKAA